MASKHRLKHLVHCPEIKVDQQNIKRSSKVKLLGLLVDEKLGWEDHLNEVVILKVLNDLSVLRELHQ